MADMLNVAQQTISDRLKAMGKIQKCGKWVPHELNERQMENRKNTCEILLQRHERKSVLYRIVTGDEKWIYFKNPKWRKSWVNPGQPSASTAKPDRFGKKAMLCVWWDQKGVVYYELLKPGETVNTSRYKQQMIDLNNALIEKRPEWARRHGKVILLHDNAPAHKAKSVQDTIKVLGWELLPHPPYSPDLAPSDYHLFSSMGHALAEQRFDSYAEVENWVSDWFASKEEHFYWHGCPVMVVTEENVRKIEKLVLADRRIKLWQIAEELQISKEQVGEIIHKHMSMKKISARWVPKMLTPFDKQRRLQTRVHAMDEKRRKAAEEIQGSKVGIEAYGDNFLG
ncbi:Mariner Mos1 transposase [Eumeta japonica]|uniref:Mariner Mos1 transposase n=1 Tax=Eumeta variegata TaxID=151549 RepID=A0A4C1VCL7_EUMVA|nr:Mariner Mos1 transposase [Eumeta japonica]